MLPTSRLPSKRTPFSHRLVYESRVYLFALLLCNSWLFVYWTFDEIQEANVNNVISVDVMSNNNQNHRPTEIDHDSRMQANDASNVAGKTNKPVSKDTEVDDQNLNRRNAVKEAFVHAWKGYMTYAYPRDELLPVSKQGSNTFGGIGLTIIDSIDTIILMGLEEPFEIAKKFVENVNFKKNYDTSTFETTIRILGGLLSAYELSTETIFLQKAKEIADLLLPAFNTTSGVPHSTVSLFSGRAWSPSWNSGNAFLAEFGSIQLEWKYLSVKTGDPTYANKVQTINQVVQEAAPTKFDGIFPISFDVNRKVFVGEELKLGARGDSFYEILLKQWVQDKNETGLKTLFDKAISGIKKQLVVKNEKSGLTYIAEKRGRSLIHQMDHLVCFLPGTLTLSDDPDNIPLATELMKTCYHYYKLNPTGIAPEIGGFGVNGFFNQAAHYLLRPETVESLFYMWRHTGDPMYRDWGWNIFQAIETHCKTPSGYSGIRDVGVIPPINDDKMESFFLAETLKYLFLLFSSNDVLPLDTYVFNTEAHPLKVFYK